MKFSKPALTYDDQIALLRTRGLDLGDENRTRRWLKRIGYYRLSAYFVPFKIAGSDAYRSGATFDQVIGLYKFDCRLRLLFLQAMDRVEIGLRSLITYQLAHRLGAFGYADPNNFAPSYDHKKFMEILNYEEKRAAELFVKHYRTKYTSEKYLPIWMVTELVPFGTLSKLVEHTRTRVRKRLAKEFSLPEPVFISWLHTIAYIRNVCAHHNRLWNRELAVMPTLPKEWTVDGIRNDRIYCVALMMQYLLTFIAPNCSWKERLKLIFLEHPDIDLAAMTFPANWMELPPWK
jgi:abortive infection bacteriophage resistance protein